MKKLWLFALLALFPVTHASAGEKLKVAVDIFEPMVIEKDGSFFGHDIDVFRAAAAELGYEVEFKKVENFPDIFPLLEKKEVDAAIAGITINEEREKIVDFSQPYFKAGLRILVPQKSAREEPWIVSIFRFRALRAFAASLASPTVAEMVFDFAVFIFLFAHIIWVIDRGSGPINRNYLKGIGDAMYFCVTTSSSTGYGDKTPQKALAKFCAGWLMFLGIAFFANLTALLSANYTADKLISGISSPDDLRGRVVATEKGTTSVEALEKLDARVMALPKIDDAYEKLLAGDVEAVVFDSANVMYYANTRGLNKVRVVGGLFEEQDYGIAFPADSPLREKFNRVILKMRENGACAAIRKKWFGCE